MSRPASHSPPRCKFVGGLSRSIDLVFGRGWMTVCDNGTRISPSPSSSSTSFCDFCVRGEFARKITCVDRHLRSQHLILPTIQSQAKRMGLRGQATQRGPEILRGGWLVIDCCCSGWVDVLPRHRANQVLTKYQWPSVSSDHSTLLLLTWRCIRCFSFTAASFAGAEIITPGGASAGYSGIPSPSRCRGVVIPTTEPSGKVIVCPPPPPATDPAVRSGAVPTRSIIRPLLTAERKGAVGVPGF